MISLNVDTAMTTPVRTVTADLTVAEAAREMKDARIGALVVVADEELEGIVTESDVLGLVAAGTDVDSATVADVLSTPVVTVERDTPIHVAAELMREHSVRRLPVRDDGTLVGIVTTTDLTHYLPRLRNTILRDRKEQAATAEPGE